MISLTHSSLESVGESLRILVLTNLYPPQVLGGYERSIADFARLLQHRGHQVLVLTSDTPELFAQHESRYPEPKLDRGLLLLGSWSAEGAKWFAVEQVTQHSQHNQKVLEQHLETFQPNICFAGNLDFLQIRVELIDTVLSSNIPIAHYVMNAHPGYSVELAPQQSIYRCITCSDWITGRLTSVGYPVTTAQTIYPGADVEAFYQAELPPRDRLRIAYASLVAPYKGADVLVEALSILNAAGIDFSATIAGGTFQPDFVVALQEFIASEGLQDKVQLTGALSRQGLIELYKTHNVLAFPSRFQEPFGISQVEAMAAGLTLVTSGTGGAGEIISDNGKTGLLFESENPLDLADTLAALASDPARWEAITRSGQQHAIAQFSQTRAVEQLETVFEQLLQLKNNELESKQYTVGKYSIYLPIEHLLDRYQATWRRYDTALGYIAQAVFNKYPNSSAIDIGANVGDSAALIRSYANVPVLCIEGSPVFTQYLSHNAAIIGEIEIEPCFVGEGQNFVSLDRIHHHAGTASIVNASDSDGSQKIPMKSLKEILDSHSRFQYSKLLKTDTDGFDFSIIQNSIQVISSLLPILYFEYDVTFQEDAPIGAIHVLKTLCEVGYEKFLIYDNFGNYLISLSKSEYEKFSDLTAFLVSNRRTSGTPAVYYFDVCAFGANDTDVFETIRQLEMELLNAS